ncbi:hypothetical protein RJ640_006234 [Escallonia rubra]|uniref:APO domain-containing protein n=1 Tax=Escallonia rubra TaxID=112253 RepID=A0AA88UG69_9ASTE|nr:hypothetical protein RJ640_006234 [Escallonia rubra]
MHCGCSHSQFGATLLSNSRGWNLPNKMEILTCRLRPGIGLLDSLKSRRWLLNDLPEVKMVTVLLRQVVLVISSLRRFQYAGSTFRLEPKLRIALQDPCQPSSLRVSCNDPQNADFPRYYSKKEKKPFPIPIVELRRAARERLKNRKDQPKRRVPPPKNGLVVKRFIPVAYGVWCNEIHVGPIGHPFKSCRGQNASIRKGHHEWADAVVEDILVQVEAYHLFDRLGMRIPHAERFSIPRVPAVVELCIQAGVDLPEFPTKRRRKPVIRIAKSEFVDADESELPDLEPEYSKIPLIAEIPNAEIVPPSNAEATALLAEETLQAWEKMRGGANKLMKMYPVRVCGYCPEVHVGPSGHKAQNCGAHKHQQRNGQHGWQTAVLDDLILPRYVWHVPDLGEPVLKRELRNFYGQAPAGVEICVQGGAVVPEQYKPTIRLQNQNCEVAGCSNREMPPIDTSLGDAGDMRDIDMNTEALQDVNEANPEIIVATEELTNQEGSTAG